MGKRKTTGGQGASAPGNRKSDLPSRAEMVLEAQAFRGQWPIDDELRGRVMSAMADVLDHPKASHRDQVAAAKVIVAADLANVKREAIAQKERQPEGATTIQVIHVDGWYGTPTAAAAAARIAAPDGSAAAPGPVQGLGLRAPLGQDGAGATGDDPRPRPAKRRKARRA